MAFVLTVNAEKFRHHSASVVREFNHVAARLVPVVKGNGYGFGRTVLAHEVTRLGLGQLAVGTVWELEQALSDFAGDIQVLEPFNSHDAVALSEWKRVLKHHSSRIIATVASNQLVDATHAGVERVLVEGATSMHRFGMSTYELSAALDQVGSTVAVVGLSLHLPITDPTISHVAMLESTPASPSQKVAGRVLETIGWLVWYRELAQQHSLPLHVSLSHFSVDELKQLRNHVSASDVTIDMRVGTQLWLGAPDSLCVTGTVLAVHEVGYGHTLVGYGQVDSHGHKRLIVVSGGTSHGVALAAPVSTRTLRKRAIAISEGISQALGKVRSPFIWKKENLVFAEPPHMHVSMLWCQDSAIKVGDELTCTIRNTTASFDQVIGLE